jgi:PAT family beta-lactamase induction signal transducer AmpG
MKTQTQLYRWMISLYLLEGIPFALVTSVSLIFLKNFNYSNAKIAFYTSLFTIPIFLKPLIAPAMENVASKRTWILILSAIMSGLSFILAISLNLNNFFYLSIIIFFIFSLVSAMYDTHVDGFYISYLNKQSQAHYIGIRTFSYQLGRLACQGGLVLFASLFFTTLGIKVSWQLTFILLGFIIFIITIYHYTILPSANKIPVNYEMPQNITHNFIGVIKEFLAIPNLLLVIIFIFFYQITENQLVKIVPLFLLDNTNHGGLGLSTAQVGILCGGIGIIGMLLGVFASGFILEKISLKKCLIPLSIFTGITNFSYLILSFYLLDDFAIVGFFIALAQFGFGISNGVYLLYLLQIFGKGQYAMSLYAIGTALMGLSMTIGGMMSGYIQWLLGYNGFFIWILLASIGIIIFSYALVKKELV